MFNRNTISPLTKLTSNALLKRVAVLCVVMICAGTELLWSQTINNTGGAVITVTSGTVLNADVINNDNTPSVIDNAGTINATTINNSGTMQGNGIYNVSGVFTNTGTFSPGTSTFYFNGSGAQTISPFTFYHLVLGNSGIKTAGGALTVSGNLTIEGAASFDAGTSLTHNFAGNWIVNTSAGTPLTYTTASTINFNTPGVPAATSISGTSVATIGFDNINVNNTSGFSNNNIISAASILAIASNITFTNNSTVSVTGNITGGNAASTFVNSTNGVLNAGSALLTIGTLTATAIPNTVNYTSTTGAQTVKATTYHHLGIDKTAQVATINATMTINGDLNVTSGSLTVSAGTFTVTGTTTVAGIYNMGAATAIAMNGGTVINGTVNITSATGTKNFSTITNNGTLNFNVIETAALSSNLVMGTNGIITGIATGVITVGGNLNVTGTGNTIGRSTITVSGTTNITGAVDFNSITGTKTFVGLVSLTGSGAWSNSANSAFILQGGLTHDGASFSSGTGVYTFNTNPQSIAGASQLTINSVTATAVTISNDNTNVNGLTILTALAGTGGLTNPVNGLLKIGGTSAITTLTATAIPNTVQYISTAAAQTVKATTYHHLVIDKTAQVATINATATVNGDLNVTSGTLTVSAGIFTATGAITIDGTMTMGAATTIAMNSTTNVNGTLTITSATGTKDFTNINLNANATLNLNAAETLTLSGNLVMANNSVITGTATGIVNVGGNLNITGAGTTIGRSTITVTGTTTVTGAVDFNSAVGTKTFVGLVTISAGASWTSTANSAFIFQGGLTHNGTTFTSGTGIYTFNTNPQNIDGSSQLTFASLTATTITVSYINTNVAGLTITTALAGTGGLTMPVNGLLILGGTSTITTLTVTAVPNTVRYNSTTAAQTVKATTYHHLVVDKTAQIATINATTTVNGDLSVTSGTLTVSAGIFTATGAITIDGTMTMGAATTIAMNNTTNVNGTLTITSATGTKDFTILNLNANATLNLNAAETLTLSGNLVMANNSVITGTATGIVNVGGNLNITGTGTTIGQSTITVTGTTAISGDVNFNSAVGTKTFGGLVTISPVTGAWSSSANSAFVFQGGLQNDNTFSSGTGTYTFNTNSQTLSGTGGLTFSGIVAIVGAITVDVTTTNSFGGNITGSLATSTLRPSTGLTLNFLGAAVLATGTLDLTTNTPNTVIYGSPTIAQTVKGATYYNLEINGNDHIKTLGAATTVNNLLTVTAGTLNLGALDLIMGTSAQMILNDSLTVTSAVGIRTWNNVTINAAGTLSSTVAETFSITGNWTNNGGTFTPATSTVSFDGTGPQAVNGTAAAQTFFNFTVNNAIGIVSTGGSTTTLNIDGAFTITQGTFTAPATMNVSGNWSEATGAVFTPGTGTVTFNGTAAQQILGTSVTKTFNNVVINKTIATLLSTAGGTTTMTVNGTLTQTQGNFTPPATLNVSGITTLTDGTFSVGTGTKTFTLDVNINSTAIFNLTSATGIANINGSLNMNGTGSIAGTLTGTITVTGNLNVNGTGNTIGRSSITVNGTTNITGTVDFNSATGTKTFVGLVTISGLGAWTSSLNSAFIFQGGLTHSGTTFTSGTGVYTFNTNPQNIDGTSPLTFASLTATTITVSYINTNIAGLIVTTALAGTGGLTMPVNGLLILGGTSAITTLTVNANPNTVRYISTTAAQTVNATTYHHLVIDKTAQVATISATATVNGNTTVTSGSLTVSGGTFTATGTTTVDGIMNMGAAVAVVMNGTTDVNGTLNITSVTGTKDFSILNINANGTLNFTAAETATLSSNLTLGTNSIITGTLTGIINVGGNLNITGTGVTIGRSTMTVTGTTTITGDVDFNSLTGIKTFAGLVTISAGASWTSTANSAFTLQGGLTHDGATFTSGTGIYTFNTNPQTIGGASQLTFDNLTATTVTVTYSNTNIGGLTVNTALAGTGGLTMPVNGLLILGGTSAITTLTVNANPNTVRYTSTLAAQTVKATTYHHLVIDKTGQIATITGAVTMNGDLTVTNGTLALGNSTVVVSGITNVSGTLNFTNVTGTKDFVDLNLNANGILDFAVAETATLSGNLSMGNSSAITGALTGIVSVGGNLSITGTGVTIGQSTMSVTGTTTISGAVDFNSAIGTKTFGGLITIAGGGVWTNTANSPFILQGGLTHNGTTFTSGTGTYTFNTNNQNINGSSSITFSGIVAITGAITVSNFANVTLASDLTGSVAGSTWFNDINSTLNVGTAILATGTLDASGNPNTVNYNGGVQTVKGATYHHLQLSTAGVKTAGAAITVNGNLSISGTASFDDAGFQIAGNAGGTFTLGSGSILTLGNAATATLFPTTFITANITLDAASTVVYNSDLAQTISVVPTYGNLTLTATATVTKTIGGAATVATDLTVGINNTLHVTGVGSVQINTGNLILNGSLINDNTIDIGL